MISLLQCYVVLWMHGTDGICARITSEIEQRQFKNDSMDAKNRLVF